MSQAQSPPINVALSKPLRGLHFQSTGWFSVLLRGISVAQPELFAARYFILLQGCGSTSR